MRISVMMALDANAQSQLASKHSLQDYSKASSSPEPQDESGDNIRHRRGYQACQRCRERKVKCDLGSVDAPHPPPCARCRRERLDCQFAATRKKRKSEVDDRESTPNKRRLAVDTIQDTPPISTRPGSAQSYNANAYPQHSWLSSQSVASASPVPRPEASAVASRSTHGDVGRRHNISGHDVQLHSQVAVETLGAAVASTQDSIKLLVDAANALPDEPNLAAQGSPHSDRSRIRTKSGAMASGPSMLEEALTPEEQVERNHALRAWSRMRFVRAGWFTASEAMQYVDYFYERLAPMSPVVTPDFKSHSRHLALLSEEPVLALAILSIASRHLRLAGHASLSRSYQIHEKLWTYLRCMVERLLWGQEQFGGGFTGGGAAKIRESEGGQITWKGSLRTLGTIEALLLLTDWQPRALHFPPGDDENYLLEGSFDSGSGYMNAKGVATEDDFESVPYASWLEPAWRSDKMSWMLLGLAQALSFELGVFDINHVNCQNHHQGMNECARKRRLRRLVLVYVAQTSGRIGIPTMLKLADWEDEPMFDYTRKFLHPTEAEHPVDIMQSCWLGIAKIMNKANNEIFLSRQYTKELTSSGRYKQSIGEFAPRLTEWKQRFEQLSPRIPKLMQTILRMEFQYARLYINSLGLQNVVESWVERGSNMQRETLVKIADTNKTFIDEVTDAALSILLLVVDGLGPGGHLRNAPVRVYLRSLSGMMFTLKRFFLGNHEHLVRKSLNILEQTTDALSQEVVDDVHLSGQTARLVQNIVKHVKKTLIRVQKPAPGSDNPSRENSRHQSPHRGDDNGQYLQLPDQVPDLLSDPLAGVRARPMSELSTQTFMPPPNFNYETNALDPNMVDDSNFDSSMTNFEADWLALPLDGLWLNSTATVDQGFGGIGPTVGRQDMLELVTNQDYSQMQMNDQSQSYDAFNGI